MHSPLIIQTFAAFGFTLLTIFMLARAALTMGLVATPTERKRQMEATPLVGGLSIMATLCSGALDDRFQLGMFAVSLSACMICSETTAACRPTRRGVLPFCTRGSHSCYSKNAAIVLSGRTSGQGRSPVAIPAWSSMSTAMSA